MNKNLKDLYAYPENISEIDVYIEDIASQCQCLETQFKDYLETLPAEFQDLFLSYLDLRNELEIYTTRKAIRYGTTHTIYKFVND